MRVWDCHPAHLAQQHLVGEWNEIHQLFRAVNYRLAGDLVKPTGRRRGWVDHTETRRFEHAPELLLGRAAFLRVEGGRRGYRFFAPFTYEGHTFDLPDLRGWSWQDWCEHVDWPYLVDDLAAGASDPFGPWQRDGVTYEHYRLRGQYADGVLLPLPAVAVVA